MDIPELDLSHSPSKADLVAESAQPRMRLRRSARQPLPTKKATDNEDGGKAQNVVAMVAETRNAKRKATEVIESRGPPADELLDEALRPLSAEDLADWAGWAELESEPAFFDMILRNLGVQDVTIREVIDLDPELLQLLPNPVYGLIFLFQVDADFEDVVEDSDVDESVWFANQTTANACATVALLNIVMNVETLDLGPQLREFKGATSELSSPLRGYHLGNNKFIRTTHNSLTRRIEHLNADLFLENMATAPKQKKRRAAKSGKARNKQASENVSFHFVAYVPGKGGVWELDGLKSMPQKIGELGSEDWTSVAQPHIQARMLENEESQLTFNLLALCRSPLVSVSQNIAKSLAALQFLHSKMGTDPAFSEAAAELSEIKATDATFCSEFRLHPSDIEESKASDDFKTKVSKSGFSVKCAKEEHKTLMVEVKAAMGEYRAELMSMADSEARVKARKMDYGPAIHCWVKQLADKGVLEDLVKQQSV